MTPNEQIIILVLTVLAALFSIWLIRTELRLKKFFRGGKASNLEEILVSLKQELKNLRTSKDQIENRIEEMEKRIRRSVQGVGIVRFKPFPQSGGNQSFAIALIDEEGDGIIISSLYAREKVSVFSKPVQKLKSEYELTAEEKEALNRAGRFKN